MKFSELKCTVKQCNKLCYSLLTEIHVPPYQLSCHSCFHLTTVSKYVDTKIFVSALEPYDNPSSTNFSDLITINVVYFIIKCTPRRF